MLGDMFIDEAGFGCTRLLNFSIKELKNCMEMVGCHVKIPSYLTCFILNFLLSHSCKNTGKVLMYQSQQRLVMHIVCNSHV